MPVTDRDHVRRSGIDLLPPEAVPHLQWAFDRLTEGRMTQGDVLSELNQRLASSGHEGVSRSALNRWFIRIREGEAKRPHLLGASRPSAPTLISAETRRLFADALRSLANDLDPAGAQ